MSEWTPPDREARRRILEDLDTNLLVEAGAGSGKTTSMVGRMVRLIRTGRARVEEIAAVTFTRKAAAELRERFQEALEEAHRELRAEGRRGEESRLERERIARALDELERGFVGTIHAFCARLLRERPLEGGVAPGFEEISGVDEARLRDESWSRFLERLASREGRSRLHASLEAVGLLPAQLKGLFHALSDNADVHFPRPSAPRPEPHEVEAARRLLGALLDDSLALLPEGQPEAGWGPLQRKVRSLRFSRSHPGWERDEDFLEALAIAFQSGGVTLNRWGSDGETKDAARELGRRWQDFTSQGAGFRLHRRWLAYRYPIALRFARTAARLWQSERRRSGRLNFQDLLLLTAALLRERPEARREMGERYRYLLVDEFQDTDPIQAELLLLLASDPDPEGAARAPAEAAWAEAVPRPGALFLVGDPKQSIYRFRRADISLYSSVKRRFGEFGDVLGLTANFRSTAPIGALVDRAFDGPFPPEQDAWQAGFAPLNVSPKEAVGGVGWYGFEPAPGRGGFSGPRITDVEVPLVASWIEERIRLGERAPGDFMLLTPRKRPLSTYAEALEERGIPVELSGSGVGVEEELKELILLLRALGDPENAVLTVALLEGLFFGVSHEELYAHVRDGGGFSLLRSRAGGGDEGAAGEPGTMRALERLRRFRSLGERLPADAAVAHIVEELGLLPHAAAGRLGSTRAAALLYALDALREAGRKGRTSLREAVDVLETALDEEVDAPLRPGVTDAVRLMNLHKAKGLQAPVVILAFPGARITHAIERHVARAPDGRAEGHLLVTDASRRGRSVIARPLDWEAHEAAEAPFLEAEEARLLYVAATRAQEELVVARCTRTEESSAWALLHGALDDPAIADRVEAQATDPPPREPLRESAGELRRRIEDVATARTSLARLSFRAAPAAARAHEERLAPAAPSRSDAGEGAEPREGEEAPDARARAGSPEALPPSPGRGIEWGTVVHRALEAAARGLSGEPLRHACRGFLVASDRPVDARGEPEELGELLALVATVASSRLWTRARAADRLLVEAPFAVRFTAEEYAALDPDGEHAPLELVEGVIDLAFRERGSEGWVVVDYKTDARVPADLEGHAYRRQLDLYAACLERVTREPVLERVLIFTTHGEERRW